MSDTATSSPIVRGGLGQFCHVCVVHSKSTRTVRTLLAVSYGSATNRGFEPFPIAYTVPEAG